VLTRHPSPVVTTVARLLAPLIALFALYVVAHGHYSPGGGFQGGVLLGASTLLLRLALGEKDSAPAFPPSLALPMAVTGVLLYTVTGVVPLFLGGGYLDYARLPWPGAPAPLLRYFGILVVEVGVALAVWGTMVAIFDRLARGEG
jgi:multicomponent Na+:H+ antiporter subunit B